MTGPKRRLGKGAASKALAMYQRGGIAAIDQFVVSVHVIDAADTPENLAVAHAAIKMYRAELARQYDMFAARIREGNQFSAARADDLATAQRLRDREGFIEWCTTCV